jgi:hypothetical protein
MYKRDRFQKLKQAITRKEWLLQEKHNSVLEPNLPYYLVPSEWAYHC